MRYIGKDFANKERERGSMTVFSFSRDRETPDDCDDVTELGAFVDWFFFQCMFRRGFQFVSIVFERVNVFVPLALCECNIRRRCKQIGIFLERVQCFYVWVLKNNILILHNAI